MLIFGHTGITLGAAVVLSSALQVREDKPEGRLSSSREAHSAPNDSSRGMSSWLTFLGNHIDMRLLFISSLLPDIIDKPAGQFFFRDSLSNGRIFCHTLAFLLLITLAGFYLYRSYRTTWLLVLSFGTFTHLIFDRMWLTPRTLLWPLYGFTFEKMDLTHWVQNILHALRTDPGVYVPELIGAVILAWFTLVLVRQRKVYTFIRNG